MILNISGRNMDTGAAFQEHARATLHSIVEKYFSNAVSGTVTLEKSDAGFEVNIRINLTKRIELESKGSARDAHAALDSAAEHAEKRLRRHKRRLKNHRSAAGQLEEDIQFAPMSVYAGAQQIQADQAEPLPEREAENDDDALPVIAELSYEVESMSVDQAVMRLELSGENCLLFRNSGHLGLNMVHLRNDGSIGWVDPRGNRNLAGPSA